MERDELASWLRLVLTPGVGNETARKLLATFGPPQFLFEQSLPSLRQCVAGHQAAALKAVPDGWPERVEKTWRWLQQPDSRNAERAIVTLGDPAYPAQLFEIEDPPLMLYLTGTRAVAPRWEELRALAIVGSRNPTPQGSSNARAFADFFAGCGVTVVSGMALGIDGAAHEGALEKASAGGLPLATIAVVGTGLDRVYPKRHLTLAHRIASHGLIVSEYPLGTPALAANFPKRNRLIAGLSQGVLVVEAALQSGSLITARIAAEQGKEVFAIPGSIHSPQSRGCHALIRQGAKLVETAQDVLEELRIPVVGTAQGDKTRTDDPKGNEDPFLAQMGWDPVGLEALQARTGIDTAALQVKLLEFELSGDVVRMPGARFQRIATG